MNSIQLRLIGIALRTEIWTWDTSRMTMTREPGMKILERLTGIDTYAQFGKGKQGRLNAFNWVNENLELNGLETVPLER